MLRIFGLPNEGAADAARFLAGAGFTDVTVGAGAAPEDVEAAHRAGLRVWSCRAAFSVRHISDVDAGPLLAVDVDGVPQPWFGSGCPNAPELRASHLRHIESVARSGTFAGFMLDGIRFASPHAGAGYFTCFCERCDAQASALGFDFSAMRRDVRELCDWTRQRHGAPLAPYPAVLSEPLAERWPGVIAWQRFRKACVRAHVSKVRNLVDDVIRRTGHSFQLGAYLFAPRFSPLVGQHYDALAPFLDVVSPMLYRTLGPGDACLRSEWDALAGLGLIAEYGEFSPNDVANEVRLAREALTGTARLVPILQLTDDRLADTAGAAQAVGVDGLDYFSFRPGSEATATAAARLSLGARS
jgi:hypothetical protein